VPQKGKLKKGEFYGASKRALHKGKSLLRRLILSLLKKPKGVREISNSAIMKVSQQAKAVLRGSIVNG